MSDIVQNKFYEKWFAILFLSQLNPRKGSIGLGNKTVHASLKSALLEVLVNIGSKPVVIPFRTNRDTVGESEKEKKNPLKPLFSG